MGSLYVIDGLDGSGKTTQLKRLDDYFNSNEISYKRISFPDYEDDSSSLVKMYLSGEFGTDVNSVNAYAASSFYAVDRYASFKRFWEQDYLKDTTIVAARYTTSNAIHQMVKLDKSKWDEYLAWLEDYEYIKLALPKPNGVIFLDMPIEVSQGLLHNRYCGDHSKKDIHERDTKYLENCRESALYAAEKLGWHVVSCAKNGHPVEREVITQKIIEIMGNELSRK